MLYDNEFFEFYEWYKKNNPKSLVFFQGKEKEENSMAEQIEAAHMRIKYLNWKRQQERDAAEADPEVVINFNSKVK